MTYLKKNLQPILVTGGMPDPENCPICAAQEAADRAGRQLTVEELDQAFAESKMMGYLVSTGEELMREDKIN